MINLNTKSTIAFKTLLFATFAVWFGGFTFYVSFVVPIGTEVLGSARRQGLITQQVTHWLNVMCAAAFVLMLLESVRCWSLANRKARWIQLAMVAGIGGMLVGLVVLHPQLDNLIDGANQRVVDRSKFYGLHRVYLWLSTFQWIAGWIWLVLAFTCWQAERSPPSTGNS